MKNLLLKGLLCLVVCALAAVEGVKADTAENLITIQYDSLTATDSNGVTWYFYIDGDNGAVIVSKNWAIGSPLRSSADNNSYTKAELEIPETLTYNETDYTVTTIGYRAFYKCTKITKLTLPKGLRNIERDALDGCTALASFELADGNESYKLSDDGAVLVSSDGTWLMKVAPAAPSESYAQYTIPDTIVQVEREAFAYCANIEQITIGKQVTYINPVTFRRCSALTKFVVEDGNENYKTIEDGLLLVDMDVTTLLAVGASVDTLTIPSGITEIGEGACYGFSKLTSVTIPTSVKTIGRDAFRDCSILATVTFEGAEDGTATVDSIGYSVFNQCYKLVNSEGSDYLIIPASVEKIGQYAFNNCRLVKPKFADGSKCTYIGKLAFYNCNTNMTDLEIPEGVTYIGVNTFRSCSSLTYLSLPSTLTKIDDTSFYDSKKLATMVCYAETPPTTAEDTEVFGNMGSSVTGGTKIYVLPYSLSTYTESTIDGWDDFEDSQYYPFYDLTISSAEMATLALPFTATIPDGANAYTLGLKTTGTDEEEAVAYIKGTEVEDTLTKGTPVVVKADAGTYCFYGTEDATVDSVVAEKTTSVPQDGNGLVGTYETTTIQQTTSDNEETYYNYVLQNQSGNVRFYQVGSNGKSVGQFRAWLQLSEDVLTTATSIAFVLDGTTTGIAEIESESTPATGIYYDLQGRAVKSPQKGGIYIKDGVKVIL